MASKLLSNSGKGRPKGVPNKVNAAVKDMILEALSNAGGAEYLTRRANDPKTASAFLTLLGKVLPLQIANPPGESFKTDGKWVVELVRPGAKADAS